MSKKLSLLIAFIVVVSAYMFIPSQKDKLHKVKASRAEEVKEVLAKKGIKKDKDDYRVVDSKQGVRQDLQRDLEKESNEKLYGAMRAWGKDNEKFKKLIKEALSINPENINALGRYSESLLSEGLTKESRRVAHKCLSLEPSNSLCNRSLVSSFTRNGEFEEGYDYLLNCLDHDPENVSCLSGMLTTLLSLDDIEAAGELIGFLEQLEAADSLSISLAKAQYYQKVGDNVLALENYELACKKGQPFACKMVKTLKARM